MTLALEKLTLKFRGLSDEEDEDAGLINDAPDIEEEEIEDEDEELSGGKKTDDDADAMGDEG